MSFEPPLQALQLATALGFLGTQVSAAGIGKVAAWSLLPNSPGAELGLLRPQSLILPGRLR